MADEELQGQMHHPLNETPESIARGQQYIPIERDNEVSQLLKDTLAKEREPTAEAKKAVEFAKTFIGKESAHSLVGGKAEENPLLEEPPYKMNNASFVYWCYDYADIPLRGTNTNHTIQTIKNDFHLQRVGNIGSTIPIEELSVGDIIFFRNDKHIGLYAGEGMFISFIGHGENNYSGGVQLNDMTVGKWNVLFQGHVLRHRKGGK